MLCLAKKIELNVPTIVPIFSSALKGDVLHQSSESLFKNWQGVMIGNGDIWFSELGEMKGTNIVWRYQITTINVPYDQSKDMH